MQALCDSVSCCLYLFILPKERTMRFKLTGIVLILVLAISRLYLQPFYSLISDCDETFNYWEPLNLLLRGFGKQTWEYSPEYAIRSWVFLLPFYIVLFPIKQLQLFDRDDLYFYITRAVLGAISMAFEIGLYKEIKSCISSTIAFVWMFFQIFNPGWFHASVELLPSSFAMILYLGSIKYALRYLSRDSRGSFLMSLTFNFIAGIVGWPFVLVLSVPLCAHYALNHRIMNSIRTSFDCVVIISLIASTVFAIDSIFYSKFAPVSWNILSYNVLKADENSGPNIFGVEPWFYYVLNLVLNFSLPLLCFAITGVVNWRLWPLWTSLFSWCIIFGLQPHKEERFLYPIYGLISLSSAVGFQQFLSALFNRSKVYRVFFKIFIILIVAIQASSRIIALVLNYTAPLKIYSELFSVDKNNKILEQNNLVNVCTGREWYHFPNSFFLPDNYRLRFVPSGFDGLLPGDFSEEGTIIDAIRSKPKGMNNNNLFDDGKLWPVQKCDYFIDFSLPVDGFKDALDPNHMPENWKIVKCYDFIDVENSKLLGRTFYVPRYIAEVSEEYLSPFWQKVYSLKHVDYCLFQKFKPDVVSEIKQ